MVFIPDNPNEDAMREAGRQFLHDVQAKCDKMFTYPNLGTLFTILDVLYSYKRPHEWDALDDALNKNESLKPVDQDDYRRFKLLYKTDPIIHYFVFATSLIVRSSHNLPTQNYGILPSFMELQAGIDILMGRVAYDGILNDLCLNIGITFDGLSYHDLLAYKAVCERCDDAMKTYLKHEESNISEVDKSIYLNPRISLSDVFVNQNPNIYINQTYPTAIKGGSSNATKSSGPKRP